MEVGTVGPDLEACALCLATNLNVVDFRVLSGVLGFSADATLEEICTALEDLTETVVRNSLQNSPVSLPLETVSEVMDCLR